MRIGILEISQPQSDTPTRFISKKRAAQFIERGYAKWVHENELLQMVREDRVIRRDIHYFRHSDKPVFIPFLPYRRWRESILARYPVRNMTSY